MKKRIVFVINYFYPDLASTGQLMTELCKDLQNDFEITVIAAQPGYDGKTKKSVTKLVEKEYMGELKILRVKLPYVNKNSKMSRVKYILTYFFLALLTLLKEKNVNTIYTISQPPILGGLIGTLGKVIKKSKHIYNIQDFNPEQAAAIGYTNKSLYGIAYIIDKLNCRLADHIVVVGNDMKSTLAKRFKTSKVPKHSVINNWTNENDIIPLGKNNFHVEKFLKENNLDGKFIIMYSGNLGLYYDLENIIKVTQEFREHTNLAFVFIGEGAVKKRMQENVKNNFINNVFFLPYQDKDYIKYSLNAADLHLVVNQKGIKGVSVPSKIYGVMAAGKPILGVLENGSEAQNLITASNSGVVVEPQKYKEIIKTINYFYSLKPKELEEMGLKGRVYLEENLKRESSINKYKKLLMEI
ncbi:Glycosyltransferase involved in cell wall bisynthesis [Bacillus sp. OV194]|nr:Glycosyltransferase involved in cell wall bisynthesis [Bacillus sp. OV194]